MPASAKRSSIARIRSMLAWTPGPPIASIASRSSVNAAFPTAILSFQESIRVISAIARKWLCAVTP